MSERHTDRGPWYARILTERGLGTLISIVLIGAILWGGWTLINDSRAFQSQMIAESVRTNEKLEQLTLHHIEMKLTMERIERLMLANAGSKP